MRRLFIVLAVVGGLAVAGSASAQGLPAGPIEGRVGGCATCGGGSGGVIRERGAEGDSRYGLHPAFKKLLWWQNNDGGCATCGKGRLFGGGCNNCAGQGGGHEAFNPYPNGVPGTLVFPQHPYIRSPRDFFMSDAK